MTAYAKTNVQLYGQMLREGYQVSEVAQARRAYELAQEVLGCHFRGPGQPFLCHLVGTASILADLHAQPPLVAAALLHAAYVEGEFGDGTRGITPRKRDQLRERVGTSVEQLVFGYTHLDWTRWKAPIAPERVGAMDERARSVLLIRLANELDDHLDDSVLFQRNTGLRYERDYLRHCVPLAEKLGQPALARAIAQRSAELLDAEVPPALQSAHRTSYFLAPRSHVPRGHLSLIYPLVQRAAPLLRKWYALRAAVQGSSAPREQEATAAPAGLADQSSSARSSSSTDPEPAPVGSQRSRPGSSVHSSKR